MEKSATLCFPSLVPFTNTHAQGTPMEWIIATRWVGPAKLIQWVELIVHLEQLEPSRHQEWRVKLWKQTGIVQNTPETFYLFLLSSPEVLCPVWAHPSLHPLHLSPPVVMEWRADSFSVHQRMPALLSRLPKVGPSHCLQVSSLCPWVWIYTSQVKSETLNFKSFLTMLQVYVNVSNRPCVLFYICIYLNTGANELTKYTQSHSEIAPLYCSAQLNLAVRTVFL